MLCQFFNNCYVIRLNSNIITSRFKQSDNEANTGNALACALAFTCGYVYVDQGTYIKQWIIFQIEKIIINHSHIKPHHRSPDKHEDLA